MGMSTVTESVERSKTNSAEKSPAGFNVDGARETDEFRFPKMSAFGVFFKELVFFFLQFFESTTWRD